MSIERSAELAGLAEDVPAMTGSKQVTYEIDHFYPGFDRQRFWDLFVDHDGWTASDILPGSISILESGDGHPQGLGAVRSVVSGPMTITEDIVGFHEPESFAYASRNGSMPVNDFGGELRLEDHDGGVLARYTGGFNPKYPATGWLFKRLFRLAQGSAFRGLGRAYEARYGNN